MLDKQNLSSEKHILNQPTGLLCKISTLMIWLWRGYFTDAQIRCKLMSNHLFMFKFKRSCSDFFSYMTCSILRYLSLGATFIADGLVQKINCTLGNHKIRKLHRLSDKYWVRVFWNAHCPCWIITTSRSPQQPSFCYWAHISFFSGLLYWRKKIKPNLNHLFRLWNERS